MIMPHGRAHVASVGKHVMRDERLEQGAERLQVGDERRWSGPKAAAANREMHAMSAMNVPIHALGRASHHPLFFYYCIR